MVVKILWEKPILTIGILMFSIFLFQVSKNKSYIATSCRSTLVMLEKRVPVTWKCSCLKNELTVDVLETEVGDHQNTQDLRMKLYRNMANHLIFIAKNSPQDSLERVDIIRLRLIHPKVVIQAFSLGKNAVKLSTITSKKFIAEHLKATVKIKETFK